jgi:hypothetical protein
MAESLGDLGCPVKDRALVLNSSAASAIATPTSSR